MDGKFSVMLASDIERDEMLAEFSYEGLLVGALVENESDPDNIKIELYPHPKGQVWEFALKDFQNILELAIERIKR